MNYTTRDMAMIAAKGTRPTVRGPEAKGDDLLQMRVTSLEMFVDALMQHMKETADVARRVRALEVRSNAMTSIG